MKKWWIAGSALTALMILPVQAEVVSLNMENWGSIPNSDTDTAGVVDAAHWNDSWLDNGNNPTFNDLRDNTGAATTIDVSWTAGGSWGLNLYNADASNADNDGADSTHNVQLMKGWLDSGDHLTPDITTVTLSEISYSEYDIYVYLMSDTQDRPGSVTDGTTTYYLLADPSSVTFVDNDPADGTADGAGSVTFTQITATDPGSAVAGNYVKFSGLTGSSQQIVSDFAAGGGIAGLQIVSIPEPATIGLVGIFGAGVLFVRRRFRI